MRPPAIRPRLGRRRPATPEDPLVERCLAETGAAPPLSADEERALVAELEAWRRALRQALAGARHGAGPPPPGPAARRAGDPPGGDDGVIDAARAAVASATDASADIARALDGFVAARNTLAAANLRLVAAVARRYARAGHLADAIQDGTLGLLRAIERFDPARGCRFSTYAVWWIRQAIARGAPAGLLRLPEHLARRARRVAQARAALEQALGRRPSAGELAARLDLPAWVVRTTLEASVDTVSLDAPLPGAEDTTLGDLLAAGNGADPARAMDDRSRRAAAANILAALPPQARAVLLLRFGLADGKPRTPAEAGRALGLSHERVRRIEQAALRRLRTRHAAQIPGADTTDRGDRRPWLAAIPHGRWQATDRSRQHSPHPPGGQPESRP